MTLRAWDPPTADDHDVCEVCNESLPRRRFRLTWVLDAQGREEGITHCPPCDPLSLPGVTEAP